MDKDKNLIIVITGPTGVGKTDVSLELARLIKNIEIISCDSMAVYKEMNIGTSKPDYRIRMQVPHHLIDIVSVKEEFNVGRYVKLAKTAISEIIKKRNIPVIVGGSLMYLYSLLDGIFKGPGKNEEIRQELLKIDDKGEGGLYKKLKSVDPEAASKIHPHDLRRIVRALEVYYQTGRKISSLKTEKKGISSEYTIVIYGLNTERDKLYHTINKRVDDMIAQGLLNEIKILKKIGMSMTAYQGHGYKEIIGYLENKYTFEKAVALTKRNTRHYAKRQLSWLRQDKRIYWVNRDKFPSSKDIARYILENLKLQGYL